MFQTRREKILEARNKEIRLKEKTKVTKQLYLRNSRHIDCWVVCCRACSDLEDLEWRKLEVLSVHLVIIGLSALKTIQFCIDWCSLWVWSSVGEIRIVQLLNFLWTQALTFQNFLLISSGNSDFSSDTGLVWNVDFRHGWSSWYVSEKGSWGGGPSKIDTNSVKIQCFC